LLQHAFSFGLFAFCFIINEAVYLVYTIISWKRVGEPVYIRALFAVEFSYVFMQLCMLISQVLLYAIFIKISR